MSGVNEIIVREFFESIGFLVSQPYKHVAPGRRKRAEEELDLLVLNPAVSKERIPDDMVWKAEDLQGINSALVAVRGWHTERFSSAIFEQTPELLRFADESTARIAARRLGTKDPVKILCLAELPASTDLKKKTLDLLRSKGIQGVLLFRTILEQLISYVDRNRNYEKSDLLQVIRIIKSYGLFKDGQMELFDRKQPRKRSRPSSRIEPA
ncbi:MAG: hypothetical protein E4H02_00460 [Lentisphaerales bacterium]|jgi:hypothetical protein|nr:MAG: hypothetical protein E4H02_00460 [Lentisphaerales bacterium]